MRSTFLLLALTASMLAAPPSWAVKCKRACAPQIRKCIKKCCSPPAFGPRKACIIGIRGAALAVCEASGPQACPKKACIIEDCGPPK